MKLTRFFPLLATVAFLFMLTGPLLARLVISPAEVENRALTPFPALALSDWEKPGAAAAKVTPYLRDQLTLRDKALTLRTLLAINLFGDSGYERVLIGRDGFMFYDQELDRNCTIVRNAKVTVEDEAANVQAWADYYAAKGGRMLLVIIPDKAMVYRDKLTDLQRLRQECVYQRNEAFRRLVATIPSLTLIDMTDEVTARARAAEAAGQPPTYYKTDTHWHFNQSVGMGRQIVDKLLPGKWDDAGLEANVLRDNTDLAKIIGLTIEDDYLYYGLRRPGMKRADLHGNGATVSEITTNEGPAAELIQPNAVLWADSFMNKIGEVIRGYFRHVVTVQPNDQFDDPDLIAAVKDSRLLVIEAVMRNQSELFGLRFTRANLNKVRQAEH